MEIQTLKFYILESLCPLRKSLHLSYAVDCLKSRGKIQIWKCEVVCLWEGSVCQNRVFVLLDCGAI